VPDPEQSNVYWYLNTSASSGTALAGSYPKVYGGEEFSVSPYYTGVKGISILGSFNGTGSSGGGAASEVGYFTTRDCSDAGTEYGFVRDLTRQSVLFLLDDVCELRSLGFHADGPQQGILPRCQQRMRELKLFKLPSIRSLERAGGKCRQLYARRNDFKPAAKLQSRLCILLFGLPGLSLQHLLLAHSGGGPIDIPVGDMLIQWGLFR